MIYPIVFVFSLIFSLVLTPIVRRIVLKSGTLDQPRSSRWHRRPVPSMGGIAIFASFLLTVLLNVGLSREILVIMLGGGVMFILGLLDDLWRPHPNTKFAIQILAALGVAHFGIVSTIFPYSWLNMLVTVFWIVGLTNALNLLDNMDGLSSGVALIAAVGIFALFLRNGEGNAASLCLALAGACLGFLRYNFSPATIFMGDCGSLLLGYMLATLAVLGGWQSSFPSIGTFISPVLIMAVAIFDTTLVTVLRLKNGKMPWQGGKDHSSHRLVSVLCSSDRTAVLTLYSVGILAGLLGMAAAHLSSSMAVLVGVAFLTAIVILGVRLSKVKCYQGREKTSQREHSQSFAGDF